MSPKGGLDVKKRILFIGTGGTIASEMSDEGLLPGVGASALLGLCAGRSAALRRGQRPAL